DLDKIIDDQISDHENAIKKIDELPGIGKRSAEIILAEIGTDMIVREFSQQGRAGHRGDIL
ncbi:MAG: hypothetical protein GXY34_03145, partial [Syntrophomonadaceae bacterium]|nr:hypothetical protein [Syntrophomonadaceae bacterium]